MRAIVTGGAGFIGSHLVDALVARGDDVVVIDDLSYGRRENLPDGVELVERNVRDPVDDVFDEVRPGVCFHLAAQKDVRVAVERPVFDAEVNVLGTLHVAEAARRHGTQIVFASTGGAIYGECERPAREDDERRPFSPYGVSKLAGEEYLAAYNRLYGSGHVSLRYANVYGPRQDPYGEAGVVAIFFNRLLRGERPTLYGDGSSTRDYVHVDDVVRATLGCVGRDGGIFDVATGVETAAVELLGRCARIAGVSAQPEHAPDRLGELQRSVLDPGLGARELGWRPEWRLDDGLEQTWEWMRGEERSRAERK